MLELIRLCLGKSNNTNITISQQDYEKMSEHAVLALPAPVLSKLPLDIDLYKKWELAILQQVAFNVNYKYVQEHLPIRTPYAILKGTSVAQYYPYPEYRTMGDIDVITQHADYETACIQMLENSWKELTSVGEQERGRHRTFKKNGFVVEIHAFFASMNDPRKAKILDDYIIENISDSHILPDMINGLVVIDHIGQHLEDGIGLRQIIDWMMFVDKCINTKEEWIQFEILAQRTGLKKLALVTTRMCEIYLGLSSHDWCIDVKDNLCRELMDYILQSGNFGNMKDAVETLAIYRMGRLRHPIRLIKELQRQGLEDLERTKKPFIRYFAWAWKGYKLLKNTPDHTTGYIKAKKLNSMFNALGIKRSEKGLVYYVKGEYIKKK